jgi:primosomal protein N' (replication factor Y)
VNEAAPSLWRVAVDCPLRTTLDYLPPADSSPATLQPGMRVRVPMGRREAVGLLVGPSTGSTVEASRLKAIRAPIDAEPLLDAALLELLLWTASYYHHPPGEVLFAALPAALREGKPAAAEQDWLVVTPEGQAAFAAGEPKRAPRQRALLEQLAAAASGLLPEVLDATDPGWREAARALEKRGWVAWRRARRGLPDLAAANDAAPAEPQGPAPALSPAQAAAVQAVDAAHGGYQPFLLQGATGSGKTEVYLQLAARALARGQRVLVLVPEIGLTPQLLERFHARLGVPIAALHSALSDNDRLAAWRAARSGEARVLVGTRSAVFAPLPGLGLIVVDEEHDSSYKQQEGGCRYSARDLAVLRAQRANVPVLLGSATPALESLQNVQAGRYALLPLPRRADQAAPPRLALVDLRAHAVHAGLATPVVQAIERHLAEDGQVLVYLNRRGYAPSLLCTSCGWIAPCTECDARLTVHQGANQLRCHYCGATRPLPNQCARCGYDVRPVGQGTERIAETLAALFPKAPQARLDRDTVRTPADLDAVMRALHSGEARILVGTQMVTKGHHFPGVTLVAVLNADQGLFSSDFRAAERLAQTIVQVAGRAGRGTRAGEVLIQTDYPEHPLLQRLLATGYEGFAAGALVERAEAHWPPFSRLALLRASATEVGPCMDFLQAARAAAGEHPGVRLLGPVPASMARRAGRHHAQLLIEHGERSGLHRFLDAWLPGVEKLPETRRVRWALDVDPLDIQ